jgi:hypothetical protein
MAGGIVLLHIPRLDLDRPAVVCGWVPGLAGWRPQGRLEQVSLDEGEEDT